MVELFSLSTNEFQGSLDEVLAAKLDKPAVKYNLRSTGGVPKPQQKPPQESAAREQIRHALFPVPEQQETAVDEPMAES